MPNLPRDSFEVFEDGAPQTISQFTSERVPVGVGLLLDVSDSMFGQRLVDARAAVERFLVDLLAPDDAFFVMTFNHVPQLLTPWTESADRASVGAALDKLRAFGGTAIYDSVAAALPLMEQRPRDRAALVLISDGADTASDVTLHRLRDRLLRTDAFIYAIAIDSTDRQAINTRVNPTALSEITNQTGGQHRSRQGHGRPGGRDGPHCRGTEHAVRARLFVASPRRREIPQHPRACERRRLPRAGAQRIRRRAGQAVSEGRIKKRGVRL